MNEKIWWFPEYVPVKSPHEDRRGWFFPYSGDEWPDRDGWCWVWTEWHRDRRLLSPKHLWWSEKEARFMAIRAGEAVAWRYAVETAESVAAGRKIDYFEANFEAAESQEAFEAAVAAERAAVRIEWEERRETEEE